MDNKISQKVATQFSCEKCNYTCCNKFDFGKHLSTRKHLADKTDNELSQKTATKFECKNCGNVYKYQSGLCKHAKTCSKPQEAPSIKGQAQMQTSELTTLTNLILELVKNSSDVQKQVLELCKTGTHNTTSNTINNNQKFNINVFLNEQCKDAINFSDFVKNIEVSREDLENNAQLGFVGGISKIFLDNLKQLSKTERPIHCTDIKRETMYIKDDDKWTKETDYTKLNTAIQTITRKSVGTLLKWKDENPDYQDNDSEFSSRCIVIQRNSMAGYDRETYYPKVIKAIAKETIIDK
jgi:predicted RNA-binding Zn-ribbon protein involved in translation (DUF1610 family)